MRLEEFRQLVVTDDVEGIRDFDGVVTELDRKAYLELDRVPGLDWGKTVKDVSRLVELVPRLGNIAGTAEPKEDVATLAIGEDSCYLAEPILEWTVQEEDKSVHNIWVTESEARKIREVERRRIERAFGFNCMKRSVIENDHRIVCNEYKKGVGNTTIFNQPFYIQSVATTWSKPFVELSALEVFKREDRGNGIGTKALQRILKVYEGTPVFGLCTYLDDECREEPEGYLERLLGFYERNGFINVNDCLGGYENGYTVVHPNGNKECADWVNNLLSKVNELSAFEE